MENSATNVSLVPYFLDGIRTIEVFRHLNLCALLTLESKARFLSSVMVSKLVYSHIK